MRKLFTAPYAAFFKATRFSRVIDINHLNRNDFIYNLQAVG